MLSQQINAPSFANFAAEVLSDTGERLTMQQAGIASTYYDMRSGYLSAKLASKPYAVSASGDMATMVISYPKYIRFLDLKKTASGRLKKAYYPIYNKPLYGFIYGYAYARLRLGLSSNIKNAIGVKDKLIINVST